MIQITDEITIDESELDFAFVRASGPGGQHVNRAATAVQLRFNVDDSTSLPEAVRERLKRIARSKLSEDGTLVIKAQRYRSQVQNRKDAIERLTRLIQRATVAPTPRVPTKPTRSAKERRLKGKRMRSRLKKQRGKDHFTEE
jgi:ribosome-associated protein